MFRLFLALALIGVVAAALYWLDPAFAQGFALYALRGAAAFAALILMLNYLDARPRSVFQRWLTRRFAPNAPREPANYVAAAIYLAARHVAAVYFVAAVFTGV